MVKLRIINTEHMLGDSGISELACQMQAEKGLNLREKYNNNMWR
jgi:hypothetical protein